LPGPPSLVREAAQPEEQEGQLSWADAQEQFSRGAEAMSQGSGSTVDFLDASQCDDILADIGQPDGPLPDFGSIPSEPSSPPSSIRIGTSSQRSTSPQPGPSGARGGPHRPPPGFVDLTTEDDEIDESPATPSPTVSDADVMETDDEDNLLNMNRASDSDKDGFQHV